MKTLFIISLLISTALCSYISGLGRSFEEADFQMIDLYVTMPATEVEKLIQTAQIAENQVANGNAKNNPDFKYEEATMVIKLNGQENTFENVSFKTGGMYARSNDKVGYNIKLDKKFLGRKNIRIRPDANDKTHLRSKLACDIANKIGVPSIQAAYARLYMNNEYWGLYTLMDAIKPSWIKQTYDPAEKEVSNLIQCKYDGMNLTPGSESKCLNANDENPDMSAFNQFVREVNAASSIEEIEKVLDVDVFLRFMAMEWLIGSFDHFLVLGHNFYFYKRETDGKWVLIEYDYDNTFGNGVSFPVYWMNKGKNNGGNNNNNNNNNNGGWGGFNFGFGGFGGFGGGNGLGNNVLQYTFADWELNIPIINTLVHKNPERFTGIVKDILANAFNPSLLNDYIDQLKTFLLPYVKEDCTPGANGRLPGRINQKGNQNPASVNDFEANIEGSVNNVEGVKSWIKGKFDVASKEFGFNQNQVGSGSITTSVGFSFSKKKDDNNEKKSDNSNDNNNNFDNNFNGNNNNNLDNNSNANNNNFDNNNGNNASSVCWSEALGYNCCYGCISYYEDDDGKWGVENNQWCGILESTCGKLSAAASECYGASISKYPCCESCDVVTTDQNGKWGIENGHWCSIKYSC
jgi:spore coat protein CotH